MRSSLQLAAVLMLVLPAVGHAARAEKLGSMVVYNAAPGERNAVRVERVDTSTSPGGGGWLITDAGAPIESGDGCRPVDSGVLCGAVPVGLAEPGLFLHVSIALGDGSDSLELITHVADGQSAEGVRADGGPGDDRLSLSAGVGFHGLLEGGPGNDTLQGG